MTEASKRPWKKYIAEHRHPMRKDAWIEDADQHLLLLTHENLVDTIIRAVNNFDEMKKTLAELLHFISEEEGNRETSFAVHTCLECTMGTTPSHMDKGLCAIHKARAVLAKMEE